MSFFSTTEIAFGLDISEKSLRLIQLAKRCRRNKVQFYNEVALPADCIVDGEIKQADAFLASLEKLIKTRHGRGRLSDEVISVLPEDKTFMKVIELPSAEEKEIQEQIRKILPQHLPLSIDDVYFDWQIVSKDSSTQTVLVGASPKLIIDSYLDVLSRAKLIPTVLEIEAAAISRLLIEPIKETKPQIVIDIGASRTGLFLCEDKTVKFTVSLPISGNQISQLIATTLDLDLEKAEQAKIVCGLDPTKGQGALLEIFTNTIDELVDHINQAISFYNEHFTNSHPVEKIILCGGGANFANVTKILSQKLNLAVETSQPWQNIPNPDPAFFTSSKNQSFVTALGLALRGLASETFL